MLKAFIKWTLILILVLLGALYLTFRTTYLSQVTYNGRNISIQRNQYGVATIHAFSMEDYLYGLGTIVAEDRLFQMAFRSYACQGRLSEFLGEKTLEIDRYMREVNIKKWADARAEKFKSDNLSEYERFEAMVNGVNDRVAMMRVLPMEFYLTGAKWQNFTINHLFYFHIQFEWSISLNAVDEYTRSLLLNNYTKQQIDWIFPNKKENWAFESIPIANDDEIPERLRTKNVQERLQKIKFNPLSVNRLVELNIIEFFGNIHATNTWAVSGEHTENGKPLLSNDPHLQSVVPSQFYSFILNYTFPNGSSFVTIGGSNPGSTHHYGKTPYYAVGFSISYGDTQDLYREKIEGNKYLVDGQWRDLTIRNETILVKTSSGLRTDTYEVRQSHRGPIIHYLFNSMGSFSLEDDTISLSWTGFNDDWESQIRIAYMIFADDFEELRDYLQNGTRSLFCANVLAITADNHIIMQQAGVHPIRRNVDAGNYIKDGTTTEHDWVGIVPAEDRMHFFDPPKGYIVSSNNKVAETGFYGGYLDYMIYTARADRADELIRAEIAAGRKISNEFGKRMLVDTIDVYCRQILPEILSVLPEARGLLSGFDCDFRANSTQASMYEVFFYQLYHLMKPFTPAKMCLISSHNMQQGLYNYVHFAYRGDQQKQTVMMEAWKRTIPFLTERFGTDDSSKWEWGVMHVDVGRHVPFRVHPLLSKIFNLRFPGSGNLHTLNMGKMEQLESGNFDTSTRAVIRVLYGFGEGREDLYLIDSGVSQNILSSHYSDQWELFKRGDLLSFSAPSARHPEEL